MLRNLLDFSFAVAAFVGLVLAWGTGYYEFACPAVVGHSGWSQAFGWSLASIFIFPLVFPFECGSFAVGGIVIAVLTGIIVQPCVTLRRMVGALGATVALWCGALIAGYAFALLADVHYRCFFGF